MVECCQTQMRRLSRTASKYSASCSRSHNAHMTQHIMRDATLIQLKRRRRDDRVRSVSTSLSAGQASIFQDAVVAKL